MAKEPILYDPDKPLAHYEQAKKLYGKVKSALAFGAVMPIVSFIFGVACILYNPWLMAIFALFAIPFTLLAVIGCKTRRAMLCLISVPLAVLAAVTSVVSGTLAAPVGFTAYLLSAFVELRAISAADSFLMLKELPGFPFFDPSMNDLSFAALDRHDADEFIDESELYSEKTVMRFNPEDLEPSEEMDEIVTGVSLVKDGGKLPAGKEVKTETDENALKKIAEDSFESAYDRMMKLQGEEKSDISDIDLFG